MKPWLRSLCITSGVGGGFCGIAVVLEMLDTQKTMAFYNILMIIFFGLLYAFILYSGLLIVFYPQRTLPFIFGLAPQIVWFSSPLCAFKFGAGIQVVAGVTTGRFTGGCWLGSEFAYSLSSGYQRGLGLNLFALALLILLVRNRSTPVTGV
jgi:hypothetical protein